MSASDALRDHCDVAERLTGLPARYVTGRGSQRTWTLMPHAGAPRILLPASPRAAAGAMWRFSAALPWSERAVRVAAAGVLRVFGPRVLPHAIAVDEVGSESLLAHLRQVMGQEIQVSVSIGAVRANRKPVLQIFDARGRSLAFAKIGDTPAAAVHVRAEIAALKRLADESFDRIEVPAVIATSQWREAPILVMSALPSGPLQRPGARTAVPNDYMVEFSERFSRGLLPLAESGTWTRLRDDSAERDGGPLTDRFAALLDRWQDRHGAEHVVTGGTHGDWTSWNMSLSRRGIRLWDFERFDDDAVVGVDAVHWVVNDALRNHSLTMSSVVNAMEASEKHLSSPSIADLHVLSLVNRYLGQSEKAVPDPVAKRADVLLAAVEHRHRGMN